MELPHKLIDQLVKDYKKPEDIFGESGLLMHLTRIIHNYC